MFATASVVAGDASARTTTSTGNTIATKHSHLVMCVHAGGSMSARSKFAHECDIACGQYRTCIYYITCYIHYVCSTHINSIHLLSKQYLLPLWLLGLNLVS